LLSYLVPGLGQIYQGRVGKGILFAVCTLGLFFYGFFLGSWKNVYLPRGTKIEQGMRRPLPDPGLTITIGGKPILSAPRCLGYRPQFAGQFWIGVAAWPALWQFWHYEDSSDEALGDLAPPEERALDRPDPILGTFMRTPSESELNKLQLAGDKTWDLGWVFTVIAGVLNVLVIYDALAGPAFVAPPPASGRQPDPTEKAA
jgi:hypothetical protein